jgi:hypothetical protein
MKLTVVSNGTKEGTFVRNADTGEALEGVEHIAFNFDGEKCVTTVMLTTGLVVSDRIVALPLTDEESRAVQDSFMNPDGLASEEETMSNEQAKKPEPVRDSTPPELTEAVVKEALRQSAEGANELNKKLKEVFVLSDASATLRLR